MNKIVISIGIFFVITTVSAETTTFDSEKIAAIPSGWSAGVTGSGMAKWNVEADVTAPSAPHVLKQSGIGDFLWCVKNDVLLVDGMVEVKFKSISGKSDQAGGVVWRWKDKDNYYVARGNALENNVSLYYTEKGKRHTIKYVNAPVARDVWHVLRVEFVGEMIKVSLDGKTYIELNDNHINGAGKAGVWTKADSVTAFDDFAYAASVKK